MRSLRKDIFNKWSKKHLLWLQNIISCRVKIRRESCLSGWKTQLESDGWGFCQQGSIKPALDALFIHKKQPIFSTVTDFIVLLFLFQGFTIWVIIQTEETITIPLDSFNINRCFLATDSKESYVASSGESPMHKSYTVFPCFRFRDIEETTAESGRRLQILRAIETASPLCKYSTCKFAGTAILV